MNYTLADVEKELFNIDKNGIGPETHQVLYRVYFLERRNHDYTYFGDWLHYERNRLLKFAKEQKINDILGIINPKDK